MSRGPVLAGALLLLGLTVVGCQSTSTTDSATAPQTVTIEVTDFSFGAKQYVAPGGTVLVRNDGPSVHSVAGLQGVAVGDVQPGSTVRFTAPEQTGSYVFTCGHHPSMAGVLVVSRQAKPVPTSSFSIQPGP